MSTKFAGLDIIGSEDAQTEDAGKFLLHGPQGSGKTTLASTIARVGKTLYIDLAGEKGTRSFRGAPYAKNIDIIRPKSVTELDDLFWKLDAGDHPYKAVVIDSLTSLQKTTMRYLMGHDETAVREIKKGAMGSPDMRTWGESLNIMTDVVTFWFGLADGDRPNPMHVVMTAQTRLKENELTGMDTRQPDVQSGALSITLAAPDYIIYTDVEEDMEAEGDDGPYYRHVARFGNVPEYRTKARIPVDLRGKLPSILGRKSAPDLAQLARILKLGGALPAPAKKAAPAASN